MGPYTITLNFPPEQQPPTPPPVPPLILPVDRIPFPVRRKPQPGK